MVGDATRARLARRCVLLVHEDAFQQGYLADVIRRDGATVAAPVASAADALDRLAGAHPPAVLVLSGGVADTDALTSAAGARQMPVLLVLPAGCDRSDHDAADRSLTAPFSGFQVVEAIRQLLPDRAEELSSHAGPHRRGH